MHNFIFFGTPYVARDTLAKLVEHGFVPKVVVTNPDAPRGRGHTLTPSETKIFAQEKNIPVLTPEKLDDAAIEQIATYGCEYAVVVAYGKIFPQALINTFPKGAINVHYSLLPKYRGASPVESALLVGEELTGVTIQQMALGMDTGDILVQKGVQILPTETAKELKPRLIETGAQLLTDFLLLFEQRHISPVPQDSALATRARKFTKEDGLIDPAGDARENWNKYRAFAEWPGVYFFKDGKRIKITKAKFENNRFVIERVILEGRGEMDFAQYSSAR